jgi:hypothetical protein
MNVGWKLKTAVGRRALRRGLIFRAVIASAGCEAGRRSQQAAFQESLDGARRDCAPFLRRRQLLRIFDCQDAATLLGDFWTTVDAVLRERGAIL